MIAKEFVIYWWRTLEGWSACAGMQWDQHVGRDVVFGL